MNRGEAAPDAARRTRRGCGRGLPFRRLSEAGGKPLERPRDIGAIDGNIVEKMNRFRVVVDDDCLRGARATSRTGDQRPPFIWQSRITPFVLFSQISQSASSVSNLSPMIFFTDNPDSFHWMKIIARYRFFVFSECISYVFISKFSPLECLWIFTWNPSAKSIHTEW